MPDRYIPSIHQILRLSEELPAPDGWPSDTYEALVPRSRHGRVIVFRKIRYKSSEGRRFKWIYEGRVSVG